MRRKTIMLRLDDKLKEDTHNLARIKQLSVSDYIRRLLVREIALAKERKEMDNND